MSAGGAIEAPTTAISARASTKGTSVSVRKYQSSRSYQYRSSGSSASAGDAYDSTDRSSTSGGTRSKEVRTRGARKSDPDSTFRPSAHLLAPPIFGIGPPTPSGSPIMSPTGPRAPRDSFASCESSHRERAPPVETVISIASNFDSTSAVIEDQQYQQPIDGATSEPGKVSTFTTKRIKLGTVPQPRSFEEHQARHLQEFMEQREKQLQENLAKDPQSRNQLTTQLSDGPLSSERKLSDRSSVSQSTTTSGSAVSEPQPSAQGMSQQVMSRSAGNQADVEPIILSREPSFNSRTFQRSLSRNESLKTTEGGATESLTNQEGSTERGAIPETDDQKSAKRLSLCSIGSTSLPLPSSPYGVSVFTFPPPGGAQSSGAILAPSTQASGHILTADVASGQKMVLSKSVSPPVMVVGITSASPSPSVSSSSRPVTSTFFGRKGSTTATPKMASPTTAVLIQGSSGATTMTTTSIRHSSAPNVMVTSNQVALVKNQQLLSPPGGRPIAFPRKHHHKGGHHAHGQNLSSYELMNASTASKIVEVGSLKGRYHHNTEVSTRADSVTNSLGDSFDDNSLNDQTMDYDDDAPTLASIGSLRKRGGIMKMKSKEEKSGEPSRGRHRHSIRDDGEDDEDDWEPSRACKLCCLACSVVQSSIKRLVNHRYFQRFIFLAILINALVMGIEYHDQPIELTRAVEISNLIFTCIFAAEMVLKLIGEGCYSYLSDGFNTFDGIVVIVR